MLRNSVWLFLESQIFGVGAGNWVVEAYSKGYSDFSQGNNYFGFWPQESHMLYSEILAESGIVGLSSLLLLLLLPVWKTISSKCSDQKKLQFGAVVLAFVASNLFYGSAWFNLTKIGSVTIIGILSLALLSSEKEWFKKRGSYWKVVFKSISISCLLLIIMQFVIAQRYAKINKFRATSFEYFEYADRVNAQRLKSTVNRRLFNLTLARYAVSVDNEERAKVYFEEALALRPYNVNILIEYSEFLMTKRRFDPQAKEYLLRAFDIHPNHYKVNLLLGQYAVKENKIAQARKYLSFQDILRQERAWLIDQKSNPSIWWNDRKQQKLDRITELISQFQELRRQMNE